MEDYKKLAKQLIEQHIEDITGFDKTATRAEVLKNLQDGETQDVFGNMSGSRTCNTYEAQQFINKSNAIFDDEIISLYEEVSEDYLTDTLKRGAETFDVVTLELIAPQVIAEMLEAKA